MTKAYLGNYFYQSENWPSPPTVLGLTPIKAWITITTQFKNLQSKQPVQALSNQDSTRGPVVFQAHITKTEKNKLKILTFDISPSWHFEVIKEISLNQFILELF